MIHGKNKKSIQKISKVAAYGRIFKINLQFISHIKYQIIKKYHLINKSNHEVHVK
jgi:hypothetical protein